MVPLTYYHAVSASDESSLRSVMAEFAVGGAIHFVPDDNIFGISFGGMGSS